MGSFMVSDDSVPCVAVSSTLGIGPLRSVLDLQLGGQAPCHLVWQAAQIVARGDAEVVVVYRALNGRSGAPGRIDAVRRDGRAVPLPDRVRAYMMYVGMWAQRFLYETGQGPEDLGAVAVSQRALRPGQRAGGATVSPSSWPTTCRSPTWSIPSGRSDCTVEVDGACAVVVTSLERARDLPHPPAVVASGCYRAGPHPGLDIGDHLLWEDYTRNYTSWLRDELFGRAGVRQEDVDVAEIYDCFTSTVLMGLEGLGLCERGGSGAFVRSGGLRTRRAAAHQHQRRFAGRRLPARDEHGGRSGSPGTGTGRYAPGAAARRGRRDVGGAHGWFGPDPDHRPLARWVQAVIAASSASFGHGKNGPAHRSPYARRYRYNAGPVTWTAAPHGQPSSQHTAIGGPPIGRIDEPVN